jgi:glycosyltransferase involved in cell wall biosynthesis
MLKLLIITSGLRCGVSDYTQKLVSELQKIRGLDIETIEVEPGFIRVKLFIEIWKKKPDIVHIQHEIVMFDRFFGLTSIPIYIYTRLLGRSVITTVHTVNPVLIAFAKPYFKLLFKLTSAFSDCLLVISKGSKKVLEEEYGLKNVRYISHGFFKSVETDPEKLTEFRRQMGIKPENKVILLFGYPFEKKGYHHVIEAMPQVLKRIPEGLLIITGGLAKADPEQCRSYLERLKRMTRDLNLESNVLFTDYIPAEDLPRLIMNADVAVFPFEDRQSASGSVATVYSYKIPMVVSDIKAFDDLTDGIDCTKVSLDDKSEIAKALITLIQDKEARERLKMNMESRLKSESIDQAAKKHAELYNEIAIEES